MARRASTIVSLLLLGVLLLLNGCRGDVDQRSEPAPPIADSISVRPSVDSTKISDVRVLTLEPLAPIVENPDTEATGNEPIGHCDVRDVDNLCIGFTGSAWTHETAQAECGNAPGSSFQTGTCPTGDRIGRCVIHPNGNASFELVHSFYEPMDAFLAEAICPGTFEAE